MDGEGIVGLIGDDSDSESWFQFKFGAFRVSDGLVSDLVKSIGRVGNKFSQENLFVGIKGVDDESHQLLDICVKGKVFF
jgi:hypothetical protein